jgi:hypothetical protein
MFEVDTAYLIILIGLSLSVFWYLRHILTFHGDQVLNLAFFDQCSKANHNKVKPCTPKFSSNSNLDPVKTPNVDAPNPFDVTLAAEIEASMVGGAKQPPFFKQEYFEPLRSNPGAVHTS